jgi:acyl-[acyl-carrier-protein]-phospholipid O-acyltransferase/long-chain-fatty-acid--[acyl-carrier-protein] ligase
VDRWYLRPWLKLIRYLALDTTSPLAMKTVIGLLEAGEPVVIYPEGRISVTGNRMKIYDGPAFAAAKSGAMVLPVHLDGPQRSVVARRGSGLPRKWFPKVTITIHPPRGSTCRRRCGRKIGDGWQRRDAAHHASGAGAVAKIRSIPETLLGAIKLFGRGRKIAEDIRGKEETYGTDPAGDAGAGPADVEMDTRG